MDTNVQNPRRFNTEDAQGITGLITGIINDAQELIRQQLQLFLVELKNDMRRTKEASLPLAVGAGMCHLAGFVLAVMLALLLNAAWPDTISLWGGFAIVGGALLAIGLALVMWGKTKFESFNPLPDKTVEALKENVQWQTNNPK